MAMLLLSLLDSLDVLRCLPVYILLPLLITTSVQSVQDFTIYRIQHLDIHGNHIGSRSAVVNMEARSPGAAMLNRKCVLIKWSELTSQLLSELIERGAGALLIILPTNWRGMTHNDTINEWILLESQLLSREVLIPVYLSIETDYLNGVYDKLISSVDWDNTAAAALFSSVTGEGYSLVADAVEPVPITDPQVTTIVGKLSGQGYESDLPSIVIMTHYDSFGLAPGLSSSGDSGGSGVAAILELARLFSILYSVPSHKPQYNLLFVLTGGGHFNYFGTKYFIEDMSEDADSNLLTDADYTLCLDSLAGGSDIFLHVSRPPKEGTRGAELVNGINKSLPLVTGISSVTLNHKKIRIGDDTLAWPHERLSFRKIPGGTLSHFTKHSDPKRKSMFHISADVTSLSASVQLIAETIARHILPGINDIDSNYSSGIFTGHMSVHEDSLQSWVQYLSLVPRSQQLLYKDHPLIISFQQTLSGYVHEVSTFTHKPDKSDPEFVVYTQSVAVMHSYSVKPAVLDLVLAIGILVYIGGVYLFVMYYSSLNKLLIESFYKIKGD